MQQGVGQKVCMCVEGVLLQQGEPLQYSQLVVPLMVTYSHTHTHTHTEMVSLLVIINSFPSTEFQNTYSYSYSEPTLSKVHILSYSLSHAGLPRD